MTGGPPQLRHELIPDAALTARPLTVAQTQIWNAQLLSQRPSQYNIGAFVEIAGQVQMPALCEACERALREATSLSYAFLETAEGPRQVYQPGQRPGISIIDLRDEIDARRAMQEHMRKTLDLAFDLSSGPLVRLHLLQLAGDRLVIFFVAHHLGTDLYGGRLLLKRAAEIYNAAVGQGAERATPLVPWEDVLRDEGQYQRSDLWLNDRRYWLDLLREYPPPVTLSGLAPEPMPAPAISSLCHVPRELAARLEGIAGGDPMAMPVAFHALVCTWLGLVSGSADIVIGMTLTGRSNRLLRRSPGFLSNILPLRMKVDPARGFVELLAAARVRLVEAMRHQRYPAGALRSDLGLMPDSPEIYGTRLNFMNSDAGVRWSEHAAHLNLFTHAPRVGDLDVTVHGLQGRADLRIQFDANPAHYDLAALARLRDAFLGLVRSLVDEPAAPIGLLRAVTADAAAPYATTWRRHRDGTLAAVATAQSCPPGGARSSGRCSGGRTGRHLAASAGVSDAGARGQFL